MGLFDKMKESVSLKSTTEAEKQLRKLKNSHMLMYILQDVYLEDGDLSALMII